MAVEAARCLVLPCTSVSLHRSWKLESRTHEYLNIEVKLSYLYRKYTLCIYIYIHQYFNPGLSPQHQTLNPKPFLKNALHAESSAHEP